MPYGHGDFPARVPQSSTCVRALLVVSALGVSTTLGYDASMMNGLNILPSYSDYFGLTETSIAWNTASVWLGGALASVYAKVPDWVGRKWAMFYGAAITLCGVALQTAATTIAMFIFARVLVGFGYGAVALSVPIYLAETLPVRYRTWGLSLIYDVWFVGSLIAAGVTYGTARIHSTWAWRLPSLLQGLFSLLCISLLFFIPESPRWLASQGRLRDASIAFAQTHSDGNLDDVAVQAHIAEIVEMTRHEHAYHRNIVDLVRNPATRRRLFLTATVAMFSQLCSNNIVSFILEINVILSAWSLVVSLVGTSLADKLGRRVLAISSTLGCALFMFIVGGLTDAFARSADTSSAYGTAASIFLFSATYAFGWIPLTLLYAPEVLNFRIRGIGMGVYTILTNGAGLLTTFAFLYALKSIGWKTYMINGAWDVIQVLVIYFTWVKTKGLTLGEIDVVLDGKMRGAIEEEQSPTVLVMQEKMDGKAAQSESIVELAPRD